MEILNYAGLAVLSGDAWAGVRYFTTLRWPLDTIANQDAGASVGPYAALNLGAHVGDEPGAVQANRQRLALAVPQPPIWLEQVHGVDVFDADAEPRNPVDAPPVADAAVTSTPNRVICIMTADCLPVVLSDSNGSVLGVAHAGWRGLAAGVLENTLASLQARSRAGARWRAWIGPAIGQAAFEVGAEVRAAFVDHDPATGSYFIAGAATGKWQADLAGLAEHRLRRAGVEQVHADSPCTYDRSDMFYSYRRDGRTGRMATLAWLHRSDLP